MRMRLFGFILGVGLIATQGSVAGAATIAHGETIEVRCTSSGFVTDPGDFGQQTGSTNSGSRK
jgi:hypothetical protein